MLENCFSRCVLLFVVSFTATVPSSAESDQFTRNNERLARELRASLSSDSDATGEAGIDVVASKAWGDRFVPESEACVYSGFTSTPYWFRFTLDLDLSDTEFVLMLDNPLLSDVALYMPDGQGGYSVYELDGIMGVVGRSVIAVAPTLPIRPAIAGPQTCYLRVYHVGAMQFGASILSKKEGQRLGILQILFSLLLTGTLVGLALYHCCIYFGLRQTSHLWLGALLSCLALNQLAMSGTIRLFFADGAAMWPSRLLVLTVVASLSIGILFTLEVLRLWKRGPRLAWGVVVVVVLGTSSSLIALSGVPWTYYILLTYVTCAPVMILIVTAMAVKRGAFVMMVILVTWGGVLVGVIVNGLRFLHLMPNNLYSENFMHVAALVAALAWSVSLTRQIDRKKERERAVLEERVAQRTEALECALKEVKTLRGLVPVCCNCKDIRDEMGAWHPIEVYVSRNTEADFSHGICPKCIEQLYPDVPRL